MKSGTTNLSVNLNKVALVRNTRHLGIPSVTRAATLCLEAGAAGITVHPRPDARHIRADDVIELAELLKAWPEREFNVEGNPFHNLLDCVADLRARKLPVHQVTFVPDGEGQFTSDHGWSFPEDAERLRALIAQAHALGLRVSLFMDADPGAMQAAKDVGADRVELYTEPYAAAWGTSDQGAQLLFHLMSSWYENLPVIITTNLEFKEWDSMFHNQKMTIALLDRLTHHCEIVETGMESYRLKERKQESAGKGKTAGDALQNS